MWTTGVARFFYGNRGVAPGVTTIDAFEAEDWIANILNVHTSGEQPDATPARISNHSWVGWITADNGAPDPMTTAEALSRVDWLVDHDEAVQVVGLNNGGIAQPLLSNAFNIIAVGVTSGNHPPGTESLNSLYGPGRTRPDLVAPLANTSTATPSIPVS